MRALWDFKHISSLIWFIAIEVYSFKLGMNSPQPIAVVLEWFLQESTWVLPCRDLYQYKDMLLCRNLQLLGGWTKEICEGLKHCWAGLGPGWMSCQSSQCHVSGSGHCWEITSHNSGCIQVRNHILNRIVVIIQWGICLPDCSGYEGLQYNKFSYGNLTSCVLGVSDLPAEDISVKKIAPAYCNSQLPGSNTSQNVTLTTIKVLKWMLGWW